MKLEFIAATAASVFVSADAIAAEINVLASPGIKEAYVELVPQFEKSAGHKVVTTWSGTMDIKKRIAAGEVYDLVIIASPEIDAFVSELIHYPGIDYVGPLPAGVQQITVFSAGIHRGAREPEAAKAWVKFLTTPAAAALIKAKGLEPG